MSCEAQLARTRGITGGKRCAGISGEGKLSGGENVRDGFSGGGAGNIRGALVNSHKHPHTAFAMQLS